MASAMMVTMGRGGEEGQVDDGQESEGEGQGHDGKGEEGAEEGDN